MNRPIDFDVPLLVTGGSGRLAGLVIDRLLEAGARRIITTTRTPHRLKDLADRGVEVRAADHDDQESLGQAFAGARRVLVISSFSIGDRAEQMRRVVKAARKAGVEHVCYTSGVGARPNADKVSSDHFWSEQAIIASGMRWTMLRHNMYAEHLPLSLSAAAASGELLAPIGSHGRGYVTRSDCARADAGALLTAGDECRIIDVTGPAVVTHSQLAEIAGRVSGRAVSYRPVSRDRAAQWLEDQGIPPVVAQMHAEFDLCAAEGHHAVATDAVHALGGVAPMSVEGFLTKRPDLLRPSALDAERVETLLDL